MSESVFDDPDLGRVVLKRLAPRRVIELWTLVAGIDLEALSSEVSAVDLGMPEQFVGEYEGHEALQQMLEMHVDLSAAVVEPEPPRWPEPPGGWSWLILPDERWNGWALERLHNEVIEMSGLSQVHPTDDGPERRGHRVPKRPGRPRR